jgi:hypothetical protein
MPAQLGLLEGADCNHWTGAGYSDCFYFICPPILITLSNGPNRVSSSPLNLTKGQKQIHFGLSSVSGLLEDELRNLEVHYIIQFMTNHVSYHLGKWLYRSVCNDFIYNFDLFLINF